MPTKWEVTRAIRASDLPPPARLVMFVLADCAEAKTAVVPDERTPSLTQLGKDTGLDRRTVTRHMEQLVADGWIIRTTPTQEEMIRGKRNQYRLVAVGIDTSEENASSDLGAQNPYLGADDHQARGTESPDLGAEPPYPRGTEPPLSKDYRSSTDLSDVPPSADAARPRRPAGRPIHAGDVVGAYVDGSKAGGQPMPSERLRKRVGKEAGQLLAEKDQDPELVFDAAFDAGRIGWQDLSVQMQRTAADRKRQQNGHSRPGVYRNPENQDEYDDWTKP
jgi:hypothetical protein